MLISDGYRKLNEQLHSSERGFGASGRKHADKVLLAMRQYDCSTVLDYGCGQGTLKEALLHSSALDDACIYEYDPAVSTKSALPARADLVACTDVLEHVEPECLVHVLDDIYLLSYKAVFLVIALTPGSKLLADGRNTHLIVEPYNWWRRLLKQRWNLVWEFIRFDGNDNPVEVTVLGVPR